MAAMNRYKVLCWLVAFLVGSAAVSLRAQGTAFYYQGKLNDGGSAANGNYDFQFSLYDAPTNGNLIAGPLTNLAVTVTSGLFTTNIDFGAVFTGTNYWLAIGVRTNGSTNAFTTLEPLQPLLPVPYAIFANSASNLNGTLPAAQLSGTLSSAQISGTYTDAVNFTNSGNNFYGSYAGNGIGLTNLNGSQISAGTVVDARLSTNVAFLDHNQTFTGSNIFTSVNSFTNRGNSFIGSFFGNGLVGWIPVSVTSTQAMPDAGYLLLSSNLTTVTLPPASALTVGDIIRISGGGPGGWQVAQNANQSIIGSFSGYGMTSWLPSTAPTSTLWYSMASSSDGSTMLAAANASSQVYVSTDGGYNWSSVGGPANTVCVAAASSENGSRLMIGTAAAGAIFYSTNYGSTWVGGSMPANAGHWQSIALSANGNNAVAASYENGSYSGIYTSTNGGVSWQSQVANLPVTSIYWISVACSANGSNIVALTQAGGACISSDGGYHWTLETVGNGSLDLVSVTSSSDGSKLAAVVNGGGIYTSANYGASWQLQSSAPTTADWLSIASSSDGSKLVAVANGGGIYISINYGVTWTQQSAPKGNYWYAVCCSGDGTRIAAGVYGGGIYYSSTTTQTTTTTGTGGYLAGPQGSAVELQYIGNGQFMPVSSSGSFWAN
jgi:photosystem II stability/assembly factor-like uncharacterized protein